MAISEKFREHYDGLSSPLCEMEPALNLLKLVVEQHGDRMGRELEGQFILLLDLLSKLHREADAHMGPLWVAAGGITTRAAACS
ncbi:hypothetical protein E0493_05375 [Roseomonas sp. M0104]|uniref:Uncharacterized protein n=1 Tax=Teichococcus coralli TaxID=2545983 RepID=A0A845B992_9PROT|nr:hypothetical protein [Pseudoroseomonas coralli]MXP62780.1 hypothetical protein [Pseudoroseomonas coralli]